MFAAPGWTLGKPRSQPELQKSFRKQESKQHKRVSVADKRRLGQAPEKPLVSASERSSKRQRRNEQSQDGRISRAQTNNPKSGAAKGRGNREESVVVPALPHESSNNEMPSKQEPEKKVYSRDRQCEAQKTPNQIGEAIRSQARPVAQPGSLPKLTPLQAAMRQKLISARFRHLNEVLYTTHSVNSSTLFNTNPTFFEEYHQGFRQQVASWPENPVDIFSRDLVERGRYTARDRKPNAMVPLALPRHSGRCTVADLGCGDASLARKLLPFERHLSIKIFSYDLQSPCELVTQADIANLPLQDGAVNIAILCLALMGTNWIDFIEEAWRVLQWNGELWIAEIKSRFAPPRRKEVEHSVGKRRKPHTVADANIQAPDLASRVAVGKSQNDITDFVRVLNRRGFALLNDGACMDNKMFVKMRFIKALSPCSGKYMGNVQAHRAPKGAALANETIGEECGNEGAVLKPCLYKCR